jgi:prepilin-type N-terminal cleavage/methylation domain-containing protein
MSAFRSIRQAGFTLPELLITILLLAILFSLGIVFSSSLRSTQKMRNYELAIALSQQAIEALRAAPYDLLDDKDAGDKSVEYDLNNNANGIDLLRPTFKADLLEYTRKVVVEDVPPKQKDGTPVRLKHVTVTVSWLPPESDTMKYTISTLIADLN